MTITLIIVLASLAIVLCNGIRRIVRSLVAIAFIVLLLGDKAMSEMDDSAELAGILGNVPWWNTATAQNPSPKTDHTLQAGADGHFRTDVLIDGASIRMLVDTGATLTALRYEDAQRLGLIREGLKFDLPLSTANGDSYGAQVRISSLGIGGIERRMVNAVITLPGALRHSLLGMNFLNSLTRFEIRAGEMAMVN